ncbi:MAG: glycine cleavage system protein R [Gammaproteobacteria bacterium]|nr:glycine cleavage system protein R [Gammaproteobacteria bacterium]
MYLEPTGISSTFHTSPGGVLHRIPTPCWPNRGARSKVVDPAVRPPGDSYLVASFLGRDRPGLVCELAESAVDCGCVIKDSRMAVLGTEFSMMLLLAGHWNAIAKVEQTLPRVAEKLDLRMEVRRTQPRSDSKIHVPYAVEVVAVEQPNVVRDVADFFANREINVEDMYTTTYAAPHTGAPMFSLHMTIGIPAELAIATIRGEFMDFCDDLNLDAMLAPVK